ncbi:PQ loop repeat-domain-containing protein [Xylariaceae sp. FL0662B]|nr:PQ loop repeat-domain-containing protein [Xylariaceae sp. FL0662B]
MVPQSNIPIAASVLGTIGTILWCVQLLPQIWTNWRTKSTEGLPSSMMFLWTACGVPFGAYNVIQRFNYPLQLQPHLFMFLCLVSWCQTLQYSRKWDVWKVALFGTVITMAFAGIETALILTLGPLYDRGNNTGVLVVGILASVMLAGGLLPPYGELWKRRGRVIGINWVFLSMDCLGAVFSLMSLAAQKSFDIIGGILYIACILLELGIFLSHIIWRIRTREIRREAKSRGKTFDDMAADAEAEGLPFKFAYRKSSAPPKRVEQSDVEAGVTGDEAEESSRLSATPNRENEPAG